MRKIIISHLKFIFSSITVALIFSFLLAGLIYIINPMNRLFLNIYWDCVPAMLILVLFQRDLYQRMHNRDIDNG